MVTTKTILFCLFLVLLAAGCSSEQKAQEGKLLQEHTDSLKSLKTASDKASKLVVTINQDNKEATKDNTLTADERGNLKGQCDDGQLLRDKLNEEIPKFKKYIADKEVVLVKAGADVEEDKKLLKQAEDALKQVEGIADLCDQLFGKSGEGTEGGKGHEGGGENEQPDFKVDKTSGDCKKIGEDKDGYWQYEVTLTGEAQGSVGAYVEVVSSSGGGSEKYLQSSLTCASWSKSDPTYGLSSCYREEGQPFKTRVTFTGYYSSKDMSLPESWLSGVSLPGKDTTWLEHRGGYYVPLNLTVQHPEFEEAAYDFAVLCDEDDQEPKIPPKPLPCSAYWGTEWLGDVKMVDGREGTIEFKVGRPASACEDIPITAFDFTINGKTTNEFGGGPDSSYMRCSSLDCLVDYSSPLELETYYSGGGVGSFSTFFTGGRTKYKFDKDGNAVSPLEMRGAVDLVDENLRHNYGRFVVKP